MRDAHTDGSRAGAVTSVAVDGIIAFNRSRIDKVLKSRNLVAHFLLDQPVVVSYELRGEGCLAD